jgi:hypothetical protein
VENEFQESEHGEPGRWRRGAKAVAVGVCVLVSEGGRPEGFEG